MSSRSTLFAFLVLCAAVGVTFTAVAAGFALEEGSARGNVDAAGLTASGGEPGSLYFNAATITELPGTQVELGTSLIKPWADVKTVSPYTGQEAVGHGHSKVWTIPSAYVTHQLNDSLWFGAGLFTRYGLGAKFPVDWAGRYGNYKAEILSFDFSPNMAWKVTDNLSLSAGLSIRYFDIELAQRIDAAGLYGLRNYNDPSYSPYDIDQNLHGDDIQPGVDFGLAWKITDNLDFGAAYHSRIQFKVKGDAKWQKPAAVNAMAPAFFENTSFTSRNYNPDKVMAGLAWGATERLTLSAGFTYTTWHLYDDLVIKLDNDMVPGRRELVSDKQWNDTWRLSTGASYALTDEWAVRAGYTWDQSPINGRYADYLVPGDNRNIFGVGLGWSRGDWAVEGSLFYEYVEDYRVHAAPARGVYDGGYQDAEGYCLALSVTRRF
jgi:long-chain fatty acid transport protein